MELLYVEKHFGYFVFDLPQQGHHIARRHFHTHSCAVRGWMPCHGWEGEGRRAPRRPSRRWQRANGRGGGNLEAGQIGMAFLPLLCSSCGNGKGRKGGCWLAMAMARGNQNPLYDHVPTNGDVESRITPFWTAPPVPNRQTERSLALLAYYTLRICISLVGASYVEFSQVSIVLKSRRGRHQFERTVKTLIRIDYGSFSFI